MKNPTSASPVVALVLSLGSVLVNPLCQGQGYDPQLPYTYAQQGNGAYSPGPGYQSSPYGQQPTHSVRRTPPPQMQPYGQLPYSYPQGQPQPKKVMHGPDYQYAPHSGGQERLAHEMEELKAHERRQEHRIDLLESRLNERGVERSLNPQPSSTSRGYEGPIYHMPTKNHVIREVMEVESRPAVHSSGCYVVHRGDSLSVIAMQNGVTKSALLKANSIRNPDKLVVGQKLIIPGRYIAAAPAKASSSSHKQMMAKLEGPRYVVSKNSHNRAEANRTEVVVSPVVVAAPPGVITPPHGSRGVTSYRVEPGDTIEAVARNYGTSSAEIQRKNRLKSPQLPAPGEEIIVPLPGSVSS